MTLVTENAMSVNLAFVGDICLGLGMKQALTAPDGDGVFSGVRHLLSEADLRTGNLECCLVDDRVDSEARKNAMAAPVESARALANAKIDILSLANNHILDCGTASLDLAMTFCDSHGILTVGAGKNSNEALRQAVIDVRGRRLSFLAFGDTERYYGGSDSHGIAPLDIDVVMAAVESAQAEADLLTVILHADLEFGSHPATWRIRLARRIIEKGAHLVIQHHPHVIQGIERHRHGLIAYSLGNFVFHWHENEYMGRKPGVNETIILKVKVNFDSGSPTIDWEALPVVIDVNGWPQQANEEDGRRILDHLTAVSGDLKNRSTSCKYWWRRCREELRYQWGGLYWTLRDHGPISFLTRLWRIINRRDHQRWITGLLTFGRR